MNKKIEMLVAVLILLLAVNSVVIGAELIWSEVKNNGSAIYSSVYKEGAWGEKKKLVSDNNLNILPTLSESNSGKKMIVWSRILQEGSNLNYTVIDTQGNQKRGSLETPFATNLAPVVIHDSNNTPWLFWSANDGGDDDIYMSRFVSERWTKSIRVNEENDVPDILPEVGMDKNGCVWVSWMQMNNDKYVELAKSFGKSMSSSGCGHQSTVVQQRGQIRKTSKELGPIEIPDHIKPTGRATFFYKDDGGSYNKSVKRKK